MTVPHRLLPVFSDPSTWCDARCGRCPLSGECNTGALTERARTAPVDELLDDMKSLVAQLRASLHRASREGPPTRYTLYTVEEPRRAPVRAGRLGDPRPISLSAARVDRAAIQYVAAVRAVERERFFGPIAAFGDATLIQERIHALLAIDFDDEGWESRAVPVVLLLERLLAQAACVLEALPRSAASSAAVRAGGELRRALAPWTATVRDAHRRALDALAARSRAPSPFCVAAGGASGATAGVSGAPDAPMRRAPPVPPAPPVSPAR